MSTRSVTMKDRKDGTGNLALSRQGKRVIGGLVSLGIFLLCCPSELLAQLVITGHGANAKWDSSVDFGDGGSMFGGVGTALRPVCGILRTGVRMGAVVGVMWGFFHIFKAAKSGGMGGSWRMAFIVIICSSLSLFPAQWMGTVGLGSIVQGNKIGPLSCLFGDPPPPPPPRPAAPRTRR